jgi:hypothetical protein
MNIHKPRQHRVWRPRMSSDNEFNPFVRSTQFDASSDYRPFDEDIEELTRANAGSMLGMSKPILRAIARFR